MGSEPLTAKQVFDRAVEIEVPADRASYVAQACAQSPDLQQRVAALLAAYEKSATFLEAPAADFSAMAQHGASEVVGSTVGPYKLLQQIGEGGMGTVFMAEQSLPVQRRVALKIIKLGMDTRQVIARFEAERQALAMMDHPSIAKVLDAGTTETGRPYFVMELVKGVPITHYSDAHQLAPRQRLLLFIDVCRAVQHAHQKGIIHRDLKPSNVLVAEYDEKPVPKVIDFGVAKAVGQQLTEKTMFTALGQVIGTIEYMSPEHAKLNQLDIDTRSDVYSLGVILYELLTGGTPFDRKRLESAAFDEMLRIIREEEPAAPSTRLSGSQLLPSIAANRHLEPKKLTTLVRGELDWIVMKALEKDRHQRYETVAGLARDIERYINDEPVEACPPSAWYRFRKSARRHKVGLTASAIVTLAALIGVAGLAINNRLVTRERDQKQAALAQALTERKRADENLALARRAVNDFLTRVAGNPLLKQADFHELRRSLLESAVPFYQQFLEQKSDDPKVEVERAEAYADLALVREELGELDKAFSAYDQQRTIFERLVAQHSEPAHRHGLAIAHRNLANVHQVLGRNDSADAALRAAIAIMEALATEWPQFAPYRRELAGQYSNLSVLLRQLGRPAEALQFQEKAVARREQLVAETPSSTEYREGLAQSLLNLCAVHINLRRHDDALKVSQRAIELCEKLAAEQPGSPVYREMLGMSLDNHATLLCGIGRREEGLAALEHAIRVNEKLAADFHSVVRYRHGLAMSLLNLCILQGELGRLGEAEISCGKALAIQQKLAADHPSVPRLQDDLNQMRTTMGQLKLAQQQPAAAIQSGRSPTTEVTAP
jgi:serine/threonine protein kinase